MSDNHENTSNGSSSAPDMDWTPLAPGEKKAGKRAIGASMTEQLSPNSNIASTSEAEADSSDVKREGKRAVGLVVQQSTNGSNIEFTNLFRAPEAGSSSLLNSEPSQELALEDKKAGKRPAVDVDIVREPDSGEIDWAAIHYNPTSPWYTRRESTDSNRTIRPVRRPSTATIIESTGLQTTAVESQPIMSDTPPSSTHSVTRTSPSTEALTPSETPTRRRHYTFTPPSPGGGPIFSPFRPSPSDSTPHPHHHRRAHSRPRARRSAANLARPHTPSPTLLTLTKVDTSLDITFPPLPEPVLLLSESIPKLVPQSEVETEVLVLTPTLSRGNTKYSSLIPFNTAGDPYRVPPLRAKKEKKPNIEGWIQPLLPSYYFDLKAAKQERATAKAQAKAAKAQTSSQHLQPILNPSSTPPTLPPTAVVSGPSGSRSIAYSGFSAPRITFLNNYSELDVNGVLRPLLPAAIQLDHPTVEGTWGGEMGAGVKAGGEVHAVTAGEAATVGDVEAVVEPSGSVGDSKDIQGGDFLPLTKWERRSDKFCGGHRWWGWMFAVILIIFIIVVVTIEKTVGLRNCC